MVHDYQLQQVQFNRDIPLDDDRYTDVRLALRDVGFELPVIERTAQFRL